MSLNDAESKVDLEPTDWEIELAAFYHPRFETLREQYDDWRDLLCLVENQLRRERGLIPA
jgi:hypothetical protein